MMSVLDYVYCISFSKKELDKVQSLSFWKGSSFDILIKFVFPTPDSPTNTIFIAFLSFMISQNLIIHIKISNYILYFLFNIKIILNISSIINN